MPAKTLFCFSLCFTVLLTANAQRALYFRPAAGLSFPMVHLIHKDSHTSFRYNNHNFYVAGGLEILYRASSKVDIYAGYQNTPLDFSYSVYSMSASRGLNQWEFPLGVEWLIKDVWFHPMEKRPALFRRNSREYGYFFLALFRIRGLTGISMSTVHHIGSSGTSTNPNATFKEDFYQLHYRNYSIFGGLTLQFYNRKRDKLHFTLLYNQGLRRVMEMHIEEVTGGDKFTARLGSRGSYFATQFKIPLRLVTFDQQ